MLEQEEVGGQPRYTAVAKVDSEIGHSIIVDAGQVTQCVFDAMQKLARFSAFPTIDGCSNVSVFMESLYCLQYNLL